MKSNKSIFAIVFAILTLIAAIAVAQDSTEKKETPKPKHTIKVVMKEAMKGGLNKTVIGGKASMKEKLALLDMYVSLVESKPPVGEDASWQKLAGGAAFAAAKVVVGREGAEAELKAATACKACHNPHKPKD